MQKVINFLIVDDVDATRELLRSLVQSIVSSHHFKFQIQLYQAKSAEQTRKVLEKNKIHLAFLDIELPDQSGLEILRFLKEEHPDCKAVMVSGNTSKQNVMAAVQIGIMGFISKPFNRIRVEEAILNFVKKAKLRLA